MKLPKDIETADAALATAKKERKPGGVERALRTREARWQIHLTGLDDDLAAALEAHRANPEAAGPKKKYAATKEALVEARAHYRAAEEKAGRRQPVATVSVGKRGSR